MENKTQHKEVDWRRVQVRNPQGRAQFLLRDRLVIHGPVKEILLKEDVVEIKFSWVAGAEATQEGVPLGKWRKIPNSTPVRFLPEVLPFSIEHISTGGPRISFGGGFIYLLEGKGQGPDPSEIIDDVPEALRPQPTV
jgi:hypothetical protein